MIPVVIQKKRKNDFAMVYQFLVAYEPYTLFWQPATWQYPVWSYLADHQLFAQTLLGHHLLWS